MYKQTKINKMRVIHILNTGGYSGAENVVISIINNTKEYVDAIYVSPEGIINEILKESGIMHYRLEGVRANSHNIKKAIEKLEPDLIHTHDFTTGIMTSISEKRVTVINHLHSNPPWIKKPGIRSFIYGLSCLKYKRILAVSDAIINEFVFGKFIKKKTEIVGNIIDIDSIKRKGTLAKERASSDIIFLGRLSKAKNPLFFLEIMKSVVNIIHNCRIAIVGDGELNEELKRKIEKLHLNRNIVLYGFQKNPYGLLNGSKVLCMPSEWEGFGMAAIEALTLGKPVVCSGVGGLKGIVDDNCGKICDSLNSYVSEICMLLTDGEYYRTKSKEAERKALSMNNTTTYCNNMRKIYENINCFEEK